MKIVLCNGGLGNQVFQYIFFRWQELATGESCYLDDCAFWGEHPEHNGFEITKVFPHARPRLLSSFFTEDVWKYMVSQSGEVSICQQIQNSGGEIAMAAETNDYRFDGNVVTLPTNCYMPWLAGCKGNIYFHGYWIHRDWLKHDFHETLRRELTFAPLTEEHNMRYAEQISNGGSVSIHIRRGDFVALHRAAPLEYYKAAVKIAEQNVENAHYFVFSDDLPWCRENRAELGLDMGEERVTFVTGNSGAISFRDMQLMSMCKANILVGGSSFSYLAALLNGNSEPFVINGSGREV